MIAMDLRRLAGACAAVVTAAGGIGPVPKLIRRPPPGKGGEIGLVGYIQFDGFSCGFVAALDVLHNLRPPLTAYGRLADALKLWRELGPDPEHGVPQTRLVRCLRRRGVMVGVHRDLDWARITAAVDAGRPVITVVNTNDPAVGHWTTICGYERRPARIYLANTAFVRGLAPVLSWSEFDRRVWGERGYGLVCSAGGRRRKSRPTRQLF